MNSPSSHAALLFGVIALVLVFGFLCATGLSEKDKGIRRVVLSFLVAFSVLFGILANRVLEMQGTTLLGEDDLTENVPYTLVGNPIQYPGGTFVLAIQDTVGVIRLYKMSKIPQQDYFVRKVNKLTREGRFEGAPLPSS